MLEAALKFKEEDIFANANQKEVKLYLHITPQYTD